ncbi:MULTISPECIES: cupredoxin domain-containing protein [unclassified Nocardiopsis]|uniref:cupredoxin domain-containing protein n=1 Tax=unclassified Nocardiopsis TaxID=2649073 RepID=UPI00135675A2|nr:MULTISPECIES: cupredoxin domain-containing protein [unclassified Nocardiopsis]
MRRPFLLALAAALTVGLAACSDDGSGEAPAAEETAAEQEGTQAPGTGEDTADGGEVVETITVTAEEMSFSGIPETLPAGTVRIDFENAGRAPHDLVVEELGDEQVIPVIDGGASESATVTLEPGTYTFYCSVGNHRSMGMEATVTVD